MQTMGCTYPCSICNWISPSKSGLLPLRKIIKNDKLVPSLAIKGGKAENIGEKIRFSWDKINVTGRATVFSIFLDALVSHLGNMSVISDVGDNQIHRRSEIQLL